MITVDLVQGSPEWHAHRAKYNNASDAPAMMGVSKYKTRDQLLLERKTGIVEEHDEQTKERFRKGHLFESFGRVLAERLLGKDLYPVVGVKGNLSSSFDGVTMDEKICFEHKTLNDELRNYFINLGDIPPMFSVQMEQQLDISDAEKVLFMGSTWERTEEETEFFDFDKFGNKIYYKLEEEHHCFYYPNLKLREQIISGWAQFDRDLESFVPPTIIEKVEAETIQALPVPSVVVRGEITASNLSEITPKFDVYLGSIKTVLSTDQDFADAEANAKNCRETEKRIEALRANIIAQMVDVNAVDSALANYQEAFRKSALQLEKAVKEQKESIKTNAILKAQNEYLEFMNSLIKEVPVSLTLRLTKPNFAEAIKGVKTIETMHSRLNDAVAKGKTEATVLLNTVKSNIELINSLSVGVEHIVSVQLEHLAFSNEDYIKLYIANVRRDEEARIAQIEANAKAKAEAQAQAQKLATQVVEEARIAQIEANAKAKAEAQAQAQKLATQVVEEAKHQQNVVDIETKLPEALKEDFTHIFEAKIDTKETDKDIIVRIVSGAYGISEEIALDLLVQTFGDVRKAA